MLPLLKTKQKTSKAKYPPSTPMISIILGFASKEGASFGSSLRFSLCSSKLWRQIATSRKTEYLFRTRKAYEEEGAVHFTTLTFRQKFLFNASLLELFIEKNANIDIPACFLSSATPLATCFMFII